MHVDASYKRHHVTVERIESSSIREFATDHEALQFIEASKKDSSVWHVFYTLHPTSDGPNPLQVSLYRDPATREWRRV